MKHQFDLTVTTSTVVQQATLQNWLNLALNLGADECPDEEREVLQDADIVINAKPVPTTQLVAQARRFVMGLDELGFDADDGVNGGDCVEFIDQQQDLLRHLPALAEVAAAAEAWRAGYHGDTSAANYQRLLAALDKLKGA